MTLLLPLGLLGLVSLLILLLIYILRPNYQQKLVSSTFIWKLSLKYKKNRIPISKLRNILLIICQLLLLTSLALMMAQPVIGHRTNLSDNEKIAIIDASVNMQMVSDNETRLQRAISEVRTLAEQTFANEDGIMTVIVAGEKAETLVSRCEASNSEELYTKLLQLNDSLTQGAVWHGSADIDGAAKFAEEVLKVNSQAEVLLYTCTNYIDTSTFTVVDMSHPDDWNVAILNVKPIFGDNNTYTVDVEVGCYGQSMPVEIVMDISGINGETSATRQVSKTEYFTEAESVKTVTFTEDDFAGSGGAIYSYQQISVSIGANDCLELDNTFNVYGGTKPSIKIQYASAGGNKFYRGVLGRFRNDFKDRWNITVDEVDSSEAKTEGYDLYVFEHLMPDVTPTDGVVIFSNPDKAPAGSGFELGSSYTVDSSSTLSNGQPHEITKFIDASIVTIAQYTTVLSSEGYQELFYFEGRPVLLVKEDDASKIVLMTIDLNRSNFSITPYFSVMMYNLFNYFIPSTLTDYSFEVGETITLNARGENLTVNGDGGSFTFETVPASLYLTTPGNYTVVQTDMSNTPVVEQFFVRLPYSESNIAPIVDRLPALQREDTSVVVTQKLAIWLGAAALLFLCIEWLLHTRENI